MCYTESYVTDGYSREVDKECLRIQTGRLYARTFRAVVPKSAPAVCLSARDDFAGMKCRGRAWVVASRDHSTTSAWGQRVIYAESGARHY